MKARSDFFFKFSYMKCCFISNVKIMKYRNHVMQNDCLTPMIRSMQAYFQYNSNVIRNNVNFRLTSCCYDRKCVMTTGRPFSVESKTRELVCRKNPRCTD